MHRVSLRQLVLCWRVTFTFTFAFAVLAAAGVSCVFWLFPQSACAAGGSSATSSRPAIASVKELADRLPCTVDYFDVAGHPAFLIRPKAKAAPSPTPWVWYAPVIGHPNASHAWMLRQWLDKGIGMAGVDVGESYGSPAGRKVFTALWETLTSRYGMSKRPCVLPQSRGGLMLYNWAAENPARVACIAGIYTVCDLRSYPGLGRACGAYGLSAAELDARLAQHNPIDRLAPLAKAGVPILHVHGDSDTVVPLEKNSGELARRYRALGGPVRLIVVSGKGHEVCPEFFECQELVDFVIAQSRPVDEVRVRPQCHERRLRNPGMGFIFYSAAGQEPLPEHADVVFACVPVWGQVEKVKGHYDWDIPQIKGVADLAKKHQRRWAIRLMPSLQGHKRPIPGWLIEAGVRLFPPDPKWLADFGQKDLFEPEWWNPLYASAYGDFVRAYGRRFDGEPGLEFIDMRYYGFWGEGHRFGATVPWPKEVNKRDLLKGFIDLHAAAFARTPLVVQTARDLNEPYPEGTAIDYALAKGCWMRRDGFGGYIDARETRLIESHWKTRPLVAENGAAYADYLAGKVPGWTIDRVVDEMLAHHVSYFPMGWGLRDWQALHRQRPDLVKKASLRIGYRLVVTEASWPKVVRPGQPFLVRTAWRNVAAACLPFAWRPAIYLLDLESGKAVARALDRDADPRTWVEGHDRALQGSLTVPGDLKPGRYAVAVGIEDDRGEPAVDLAIDGGNGKRRFVLGQIEVGR